MPRESNLEFKVGLFVLLALIGLVVFVFSITDFTTLAKGTSLKVVFEFVNGLKKSAPVRVAGFDQGTVKDINLFFDREDQKTKVEVELWLKKNIQIPGDSTIRINQLGLMGEKYVEIFPGLDTKNFFKEGDMIQGKDPIAQEIMAEEMRDVITKVEDAVGGINKIINDEKNLASISNTLENFSLMTASLDNILNDLKAGHGTIGRLFYDERLYNDLQELTSDLKENPWKLLYRPKGKKKY